MATLNDIHEILIGKKIYDGSMWHVYDAADNELTDTLGVLWRANPGALLMWPREEVVEEAIRPSGGFTYPLDTLRSPRHVSKTALKVIKRVAKKQVEELVEQESEAAFTQELMTALAKADLQYKSIYDEILQEERSKIIDAEIKRLIGIKRMQDEDEEVLAILMASMY